jgi:hypothetical protein
VFEYQLERSEVVPPPNCNPFLDPSCDPFPTTPPPVIRTFPSTTTSVTDTDVTVGRTYNYVLSARNVDGNGNSDSAAVRAGFANVSPPSADDVTLAVRSGDFAQMRLGGSDGGEGNLVSASELPEFSHGTLSGSGDGYLTYTPEAGYTGPDSGVFEVEDSNGAWDTGTVSITVTDSATGDSFITQKGYQGRGVASGIGLSAEHPTQALVAPSVTGTVTVADDPAIEDPAGFVILGRQYRTTAPPGTVGAPAVVGFEVSGTLVANPSNPELVKVFRNGSVVPACANGSSVADPDPCLASRHAGPDWSQSIRILTTDSNSEWSVAVDAAGNHPPVAPQLAYTLRSGTSVQAHLHAEDEDGDLVEYAIDTPPAHGTLSGPHLDLPIYTPDAGYVGPDSFEFTVRDRRGASDSGTVQITVTDPENGAVGVSQSAAAGSNVGVSNGQTAASVSTPNAGQVTIAEDSSVGDPSGYQVVGSQYQIDAPPASVDQPLQLTFQLPLRALPDGVDPLDVDVFRNGVVIENCADQSGRAEPDPCVHHRTDGDPFSIVILSSHASTWTLGVPQEITLISIDVTPASPSIAVGETQQFGVMGTYSDDSTADLTSSAAWNSSQTDVATIDSAGLATALNPGTTSITASVGAVSGAAQLAVTKDSSESPPVATPRATCSNDRATQVGTHGPDTITGTPGHDVINALGGDDVVYGLGGNDLICGGEGNDTLNGGRGGDRLLGEVGLDKLRGGPGLDFCKGGPQRDAVKRCEAWRSVEILGR